MVTQAAELASSSAPEGPARRPPSFLRQFVRLAGPYWQSEEKWKVRGLTAALVVLTVGQVALVIWMNYWNAGLFDALDQKSLARFLVQIGFFAIILASTMAVNVAHLVIKRRIQLNWRRWLTRRMVELWMADGHHYQLSYLPGQHDNPDGRIAEDIRNTTEVAIELGHSFFYSALILVSFVGILWSVSGTLHFTVGENEFLIRGHMVWLAILYAAVGSSLAYFLGRPYTRATDQRQTVEANLRFGLARARGNSEAITLIRGEGFERQRVRELFADIQNVWHRQTAGLGWILLFTSGYGTLAAAFPILVAAPRYIAGSITLGILVQTAQAFQQVTSALSWPVDNLARRAEWRASADRVLVLYRALQGLTHDLAHLDGRAIVLETASKPNLVFRKLSIANPGGELILAAFNAEIELGERVLIAGDSNAAVKLFKVVAGLWPWGEGRVELPSGATIFFMPQRPYLPDGSLRGVVSYPSAPSRFELAAIGAVLQRTGLGHLIPRLDEAGNWEETLTVAERQRLGFARLLLHRPNWIFLQEATDALDQAGEGEMMQLLQQEFRSATILTLGHHASLEAYHQRTLTLTPPSSGLLVDTAVPPRQAAETKRMPALNWLSRALRSFFAVPTEYE